MGTGILMRVLSFLCGSLDYSEGSGTLVWMLIFQQEFWVSGVKGKNEMEKCKNPGFITTIP